MADENVFIDGFGEAEQDAIGEIMNITMGSAATAVSNMLSAKVWITTPTVAVVKAGNLVYPELEPSIHVKIEYIQGVSGQNVLVLKQDDVQLILCQLMGMPLEVTDDFEFDEMNISAVCEVMNQMMGASATALAELINTPIDISTPQAVVNKVDEEPVNPYDVDPDDYVCMIKFKLTIDGVINSQFISILTIDLAKELAQRLIAGYSAVSEPEPPKEDTPAITAPPAGGALSQEEINALLNSAAAPEPQPAAAPSQGGTMSQEEINAMLSAASQPQAPVQGANMQNAIPQGAVPQNGMPQAGAAQAGIPQGYMPQNGIPMYGGYPYPPQPMYGYPMQPQRSQAVNVQAVQLQSFDSYTNKDLNADQNDNLRLLMDVPLNVTVEIGSTSRKIKEILDFSQGTIIELERQAGAPVDVIVNGHLIAKGDVVVIDDNFAVRITEIIKSKFLDNLGKE